MATIYSSRKVRVSAPTEKKRKAHIYCIFGDIKHKKFSHFKFYSTERKYPVKEKISRKCQGSRKESKCTHRGEKGSLRLRIDFGLGNLAEQNRREEKRREESYIGIENE